MKYHYQRGTGRKARRRRILYTGAASLLVIVLCTGALVFRGQKTAEKLAVASRQTTTPQAKGAAQEVVPQGLRSSDCGGGGKKHAGLERSSVSQLRKLAEYEFVCGGAVAGQVSFFVPTPTTPFEAENLAKDTAANLKEFATFNIPPIVFLEPSMLNGQLLNMQLYQAGGYDSALDAYFAGIKHAGITDAQMGMWVPLPEWNIPVWGNTDPAVFGNLFTRTVRLQKKHFPASKASILLESKTYPSGSSWERGAYTSLLPYAQGIPKGLADSFGLQGFPWGADAWGNPSVLDPAIYLRTDLALPVAQALGVPQVWFNTGTFSHFAKEGFASTALTAKQRQDILDGTIRAAKTIKASGLSTAVHLFARDKANTPERVNWSYWPEGQPKSSPGVLVFKTFVHDARAAGVPLWVYDNGAAN